MPEKLAFYLVDVFTSKKYSGNQLAVFLLKEDLDTSLMQAIAKEINFSETTFIYPNSNDSHVFKTRIFTPNSEIPFAGHPALGTAYIIKQYIVQRDINHLILDLPVGRIPITINTNPGSSETYWMKQNPPVFNRVVTKEEVFRILQLASKDINTGFPIQEVSTGLPYFIVPLNSLEAIRNAEINLHRYNQFVKKYNRETGLNSDNGNVVSSAFFLFTKETHDPQNQIHARMFDPFYGVPEDAATGSANGCLMAYLIKHRFFDTDNLEIKIEQGYEMGRPSLIRGKAFETETGDIEINIGGEVQYIAKGSWEI